MSYKLHLYYWLALSIVRAGGAKNGGGVSGASWISQQSQLGGPPLEPAGITLPVLGGETATSRLQ